MTILASKFAKGALPVVTGDCAGDLVVNEYFYDLTAAQNIVNDIIDIGVLPAYHTVVDMVLVSDDLDANASPAVALDVGLMSGTVGDTVTARTCGTEFFAADTGARTGAVSRMSAATGFKVQATEANRSLGVKIQAASATAAAGRIRLVVSMAPVDHKVAF